MANTAAQPARLAVFLARDAPVGVVLRRGPSEWAQLSRWERRTDTFEHGQWLHARVYERRCDLSPDGSLFIYVATKQGAPEHRDPSIGEAWTALSRPPYFTAITLWPQLGTWYGGGAFESDRHVLLDVTCSADPHPEFPAPRALRLGHVGAESAPWERRLLRDGWVLAERGFHPRTHRRVGERELWRKRHRSRDLTLVRQVEEVDFGRYGGPYADTFWIETDGGDLLPMDGVSWADWEGPDRLALVRDGCLLAATVAGDRIEESLLCDFNPLAPREVAPPAWARRR
jgi:hypothetical protein